MAATLLDPPPTPRAGAATSGTKAAMARAGVSLKGVLKRESKQNGREEAQAVGDWPTGAGWRGRQSHARRKGD